MSVRDGLLAILTIGSAYGHQLHGELRVRAAHRGPVNVGQIYTTLDRLSKQNLIQQTEITDDGLPLHRLTEAGTQQATTWMSVPSGVSADWTEMLDQVLITSTIDVEAARRLSAGFESAWRSELIATAPVPDTVGTARAALGARQALARAAIEWLGDFQEVLRADAVFGFSETRPRRGRRPGRPAADRTALPAPS